MIGFANRILSIILCLLLLLSVPAAYAEEIFAAQIENIAQVDELHIEETLDESADAQQSQVQTEAEQESEIQLMILDQMQAEAVPPEEPAAELYFDRSSLVIGKGDTLDLNRLLTVIPVDDSVLQYSSSKSSYVSVSESGVIKGKKNGSSTITVTADTGLSAKIKITVKSLAAAKHISFSPQKLTLGIGNTGSLKVKFSSGYAGLYTLSSSDPTVAEIDANGNVIARSDGTATITVSLDQKPGVVKTTTVTVKAAPQSILLLGIN